MKENFDVQVIASPSTKREGLTDCEYCKILQVQRFIEGMGSEIDFVEDNFISVDGQRWQVLMEQDGENCLLVGFHLNVDPAMAATIIKKLSTLSLEMNIEVEVMESYAFDCDDKGFITEVKFGEDAYKSVGREPL
jgi:hypothetical protein